MNPILQASGLSKRFQRSRGWLQSRGRVPGRPDAVTALDGVSLEIREGEVFALLGPNGAGKSTLIRVLCSLIIPDGGKVLVGGRDAAYPPGNAARLVGLMTPEERSFYWRLTGRENLDFYAALYGLSAQESRRRIAELAEFLGLADLDQRFQEYSTGAKQKLAIARCLLSEPRLLFMDEPTRSLDPAAAAGLRTLIRERLSRGRGMAVFFSTHQPGEASEIADRIGIMKEGRLAALGTMEELGSAAGLAGAGLEEIFLRLTA